MGYDTTAWTTAGNTLTIGGTTMYANFFINSAESYGFAAGNHEMLIFEHSNYSQSGNTPHLGTGTDPATSLDTGDFGDRAADDIVPVIWYIPDSIYIDAVYSLEGADANNSGGADTTRMHLMGFDFNSGSTSCLTNGILLAHNSDVTNEGNEQIYLSTWTVDSPSVLSGKVIVATFESDTVNSDYSLNVKVKYHLT